MSEISRCTLLPPVYRTPIPWYSRPLAPFAMGERRRSHQILEELTRGSTLLHNNGDGPFTDVSDVAGVRDGQWGWSAEFLDYDNDGLLDIYAVNGFVTGELPDDI